MFEICFLKWENSANVHIVCWILIVQSDTLPVVGVPRQWLSRVGGGTPIFSYIFRFGALFLVQNFRKVILLEVWRFVDIFFFFLGGGGGGGEGGSLRNWTFFLFLGGGAFLYILGLFKVKIQNENNFWVCLIFPTFLFFLGWGGKQ